jgi:D-glycero-D-manno-heptose 1,7-bisphosphate phosphatase
MIDALFLDRDGIINEIVMREAVVGSPRNLEELKIRDDFSSFYQKLSFFRWRLLVVSNQPDVRRKLMSQEILGSMTEVLLEKFPKLEFDYCVHDDLDQCSCRKPKPGMIAKGLIKHRIKPERAVMIGDSNKDIEAGQRAGLKTILLRTPYNQEQTCSPDFSIDGLSEIFTVLGHQEE